MSTKLLEFEKLDGGVLLKSKDVAGWLGIADSTVWKWTNEGKLPAPVSIDPRATRWKTGDIRTWLAAKTAGGATNG